MRKITCSLFISSVIFTSILSADSSKNIKEIDLPKEFKNSSKVITEEECIKFLGKENYDFIIEVYNDKMIPMLKCKEEMRK